MRPASKQRARVMEGRRQAATSSQMRMQPLDKETCGSERERERDQVYRREDKFARSINFLVSERRE